MFEVSQNSFTEQPKNWSVSLNTTVEHIARFIDIPLQSLQRKERLSQPRVQSRLREVHALLQRVRPWFSNDQAAWAWFIGEPLAAFGGLTPSEVIKQFHGEGIVALNDYLTAKSMGGFE